jgi:hypothetical protein
VRHLLSIILSLVLGPLIYVAAGYSAVKLTVATAGATMSWGDAALGLVAAVLAGGCYAILVMARLSPFGPILAGLIYLGVTLWALLDTAGFGSSLPASVLGEHGVLQAPAGAGTVLLAVPLLATVFSPRRWRNTTAPLGEGAAPVYPSDTASAAPNYGEPPVASYEAPVYTPSSTSATPATTTDISATTTD